MRYFTRIAPLGGSTNAESSIHSLRITPGDAFCALLPEDRASRRQHKRIILDTFASNWHRRRILHVISRVSRLSGAAQRNSPLGRATPLGAFCALFHEDRACAPGALLAATPAKCHAEALTAAPAKCHPGQRGAARGVLFAPSAHGGRSERSERSPAPRARQRSPWDFRKPYPKAKPCT